MSEAHPLPTPKRQVKFSPASQRIMEYCEKAFASNNFLLLYFSNKKTFTQQFSEFEFKELLRNKFKFLQLSRIDRAGNWLTTTFSFKKSPYFVIMDPSNGQFVEIRYGDMTTAELRVWITEFLAKSPKFAQAQSVFPGLIEETKMIKKKTSFSYATKLRVTFSSEKLEDKIIYVNKAAPLEMAFDKYCKEKGVDINDYYFLFRGVQMPGEMTASQFGLRNGSVVYVHPLEDKTSTEPLRITVMSVNGESANFTVQKGKKVGAFLKNYCETNGLNMAHIRFTFNNEMIDEDLTFAEHHMKNDDQIFSHMKQFPQANDFVYQMLNPAAPEMPMAGFVGMPQMPPQPQEAFDVPMTNPNLMYMYPQQQRPMPAFNPHYPAQAFPMPPAKNMHAPPQPQVSNIWESFDLSAMQ